MQIRRGILSVVRGLAYLVYDVIALVYYIPHELGHAFAAFITGWRRKRPVYVYLGATGRLHRLRLRRLTIYIRRPGGKRADRWLAFTWWDWLHDGCWQTCIAIIAGAVGNGLAGIALYSLGDVTPGFPGVLLKGFGVGVALAGFGNLAEPLWGRNKGSDGYILFNLKDFPQHPRKEEITWGFAAWKTQPRNCRGTQLVRAP